MNPLDRLICAVAHLTPSWRAVTVAILLAALSAALPTLAALSAVGAQQRVAQTDRLLRGVEGVQNFFSLQLDRNQSVASELAARRNIEAAVRFRSQPELRRTLVGLKETTGDDFIAFFDKDGALIERDPATVEAPENSSALAVALGGRATAAFGPYGQGLALAGAAPVTSEGNLVGAVLVGEWVDASMAVQVRRLTGLEVGFVSPETKVAVGSLPEWASGGLLEAVDERVRQQLPTRDDRLFADRTLAGKLYHVAFTPLPGLGGRPVGIVLLALPASGPGSLGADLSVLLWPWLALVPVWIAAALLLHRLLPAVPAPPALVLAPSLAPETQVLPEAVTPPQPAPLIQVGPSSVNGAAAPPVRVSEERVEVGPLVIDRAAHEAWMAGKPVALTRTEFALLWQLASNVGRAQSRDDLIDAVWGEDQMAEPAMVDAHIGNLRRKIEPQPGRPTFVVTVRGVGYKMVLPEVSNVPV